MAPTAKAALPRFVTGSLMRHVVFVAGTGAIGLARQAGGFAPVLDALVAPGPGHLEA